VSGAEEIRYLILAAQREGNRLLAAGLRPLGLTPAQAEVISVLADRKVLTLGGLGALLVCETGTNPSRLVDRLVGAGLVERTRSEADGREVLLQLTSQGRRTATEVRRVEAQLYAEVDRTSAGHDLAAVARFLRALVDDLPAGEAVARRFPA
jgi:MarR family transcriptional regulator, organic hydroperoxide resistance regulator